MIQCNFARASVYDALVVHPQELFFANPLISLNFVKEEQFTLLARSCGNSIFIVLSKIVIAGFRLVKLVQFILRFLYQLGHAPIEILKELFEVWTPQWFFIQVPKLIFELSELLEKLKFP